MMYRTNIVEIIMTHLLRIPGRNPDPERVLVAHSHRVNGGISIEIIINEEISVLFYMYDILILN